MKGIEVPCLDFLLQFVDMLVDLIVLFRFSVVLGSTYVQFCHYWPSDWLRRLAVL